MMQEARTSAPGHSKPASSPAKRDRPVYNSPAYHSYNTAVHFLHQGKFDKALTAFEKLLTEAPEELKERCRMYATACRRQMMQTRIEFETPEEHYDYAISLLNTGEYDEAREQLGRILSRYPEADYAYYGLAVLEAMLGRTHECLAGLARAIELNPRNRLQARVDNDFQNMVDDPRFTELLYPE